MHTRPKKIHYQKNNNINCNTQTLVCTHTHSQTLTHTREYTENVRQLWATIFFRRNVHIAEASLLKNKTYMHRSSNSSSSTTFFKMGAGAMLLLWSFSECFNNEQIGREIWRDPTFAIFMCFGDLLLLLWMWGVSISVWQRAGIDYIRLLNLEGTGKYTSTHINLTECIHTSLSSSPPFSSLFLSLPFRFILTPFRTRALPHA